MPCRTERYDVFISYRWNEWDEILSCGLYDTLSYFAVGMLFKELIIRLFALIPLLFLF